MKSLYISTILALLFISFSLPGNAQSNYVVMGNKAYENKQYIPAIEYYNKALNRLNENRQERNEILYKIADCYRLTNNHKKAENTCQKLIKSKYSDEKPEILLNCANSLVILGQYAEALPLYERFLQKFPQDQSGLIGKATCEMGLYDTIVHKKWIVNHLTELNTSDDDFAAFYADNKSSTVIFTSNRKGATGKEMDNWTGGYFSDLFTASINDQGKWEKVRPLDSDDRVNTVANEGAGGFDNKFKTLCFTRCEKAGKISHFCKIMETDRSGNGWTKPVVIYQDSLGNAGHPALSQNRLLMVFSSNRTDGSGGRDLWIARRASTHKPFTVVENLGKQINTAGDEMFPTIVGDSLLYFASNGHPGLGGLDLYKVSLNNISQSVPEHLPRPVNSNGDDFAISFEQGKERGFFTSRRQGGKGGDDIYSFEKLPPLITLNGLLIDDVSREPMADIKFSLVKGKNDTLKFATNSNGSFSIKSEFLKSPAKYSLIFAKTDYFTRKSEIVIPKTENDTSIFVAASLIPIPEKPIVLPDIYYELDKWDLLPQYQDSLIVLVGILNDNPNIVIELASHTDSRASDGYNDQLSQKRAESVVNFLTSKGIEQERLVAKGYGERMPRVLNSAITKDGFIFNPGIKLTESYILSIKDLNKREAAYQLNRRTEFSVISKNFKK